LIGRIRSDRDDHAPPGDEDGEKAEADGDLEGSVQDNRVFRRIPGVFTKPSSDAYETH